MKTEIKENEIYKELELFIDDVKVGEAEIELSKKSLSRYKIYEGYQNRGYGQMFLQKLIDQYDIHNLWVESDNEKAIHIYEKAGFTIDKTTMYGMRI